MKKKKFKIIKNCQICKKKMKTVINLGLHPLCDDLIKIYSNKQNDFYPIELLYCSSCVIVNNKYQINDKILFPKNYHYRAKLTNDVLLGQKNLVKNLKSYIGSLKNKIVLDVGCNDGALLDVFKEENCKTIGVEPTNASSDCKKIHNVFKSYFNQNTAKKIKQKFSHIDIITFTNVFAHINNFEELIKSLKILIGENTIVVIENHYLGSIIKRKQFDTFYHEHPRTYSLNSLNKIATKLDLNLSYFSFPKRYGGNIQVIFSKKKNKLNFLKIIKKEKYFFQHLNNLNYFINNWKLKMKKKILILNKKYGLIPCKAFPGRAAILINLLKINEKNISSVYEKIGSKKIGFYVPGTKIPIISDSKIKNLNSKIPIINLAWHIKKEIKTYLRNMGIKNPILNILN